MAAPVEIHRAHFDATLVIDDLGRINTCLHGQKPRHADQRAEECFHGNWRDSPLGPWVSFASIGSTNPENHLTRAPDDRGFRHVSMSRWRLIRGNSRCSAAEYCLKLRPSFLDGGQQ